MFAFSTISGGISASISLLPICCLGIVIFRLTLYIVPWFAYLDVLLHNFIVASKDATFVGTQIPHGENGRCIPPSLYEFSPLSLMAMMYFCTVKVIIAIFSGLCLWMITVPVILVGAQAVGNDKLAQSLLGDSYNWAYQAGPQAFVGLAVCVLLGGVLLMHLVCIVSTLQPLFFARKNAN